MNLCTPFDKLSEDFEANIRKNLPKCGWKLLSCGDFKAMSCAFSAATFILWLWHVSTPMFESWPSDLILSSDLSDLRQKLFDFCLYGRVCHLFVSKQMDLPLPDAFDWRPPSIKEIKRGFAPVDNILYGILYSYHFKEEFVSACRKMQANDQWKQKASWPRQTKAKPAAATAAEPTAAAAGAEPTAATTAEPKAAETEAIAAAAEPAAAAAAGLGRGLRSSSDRAKFLQNEVPRLFWKSFLGSYNDLFLEDYANSKLLTNRDKKAAKEKQAAELMQFIEYTTVFSMEDNSLCVLANIGKEKGGDGTKDRTGLTEIDRRHKIGNMGFVSMLMYNTEMAISLCCPMAIRPKEGPSRAMTQYALSIMQPSSKLMQGSNLDNVRTYMPYVLKLQTVTGEQLENTFPAIDWADIISQGTQKNGEILVASFVPADLFKVWYDVDPDWRGALCPPNVQEDIVGLPLTQLTFDLLNCLKSFAKPEVWKASKWVYLEPKNSPNIALELLQNKSANESGRKNWKTGPNGMRSIYIYKGYPEELPAISERTRVAVGQPRLAGEQLEAAAAEYGVTPTGRPKKKCPICGKIGASLLPAGNCKLICYDF